MRDIKFRAWDDIAKCMRHRVLQNSLNYWIYSTGIDLVKVGCKNGDAPIMQFTGLKDKNGKEIYEGDIVASGNFNYIVEWNCNGHWHYKRTPKTFITVIDYWQSEVIGNIHENLELLEGGV